MQTLVLTDVATGWTECAPLLVREQRLLTEVLGELRKLLPFPLLGLDTDNDSVFMNETVLDYYQQAGIEFTRSGLHACERRGQDEQYDQCKRRQLPRPPDQRRNLISHNTSGMNFEPSWLSTLHSCHGDRYGHGKRYCIGEATKKI